MDINNNKIVWFDKNRVANTFNDFFTTVATKLVDKLPNACGLYGGTHIQEFYRAKGVIPNSCKLKVVSEGEIRKALNKVNQCKASGLDDIPALFIKDGATAITHVITHIINLSLTTGTVPEDFKLARVVPLFKKSSRAEAGNYRPVSILSVLSKVLERVVYNQIYAHLQEYNLMYEFQSGFRKSYSTETCVTHLSDYIRTEIDKGNFCGMVLLDLQKAFDTVNSGILLNKLQAIGLDGAGISWFSSYLNGRKQVVDVNGTFSEVRDITCGVPQGSILGPLLFLIYVNDMESAVKCKLLLYADDSALLYANKDVQNIESTLSSELGSISRWLIDNKLSLHIGKSESILFGNNRMLKQAAKLEVSCCGFSIEPSNCIKYLGVIFDQNMSGASMANKVIAKINARIKMLFRLSGFLDTHTSKLLSNALIQCLFDYSCCSWYSGLSQSLKHKLQVCQNKLIRVTLKLSPRTHIDISHFSKLNWLPVKHRVQFLITCHMAKIMHGQAPNYLSRDMPRANTIHAHYTRASSEAVVLPRFRTVLGKNSFKYTASKLWNSLDSSIQNIRSPSKFKPACKNFLFRAYESECLNQFI